MNVALRDALWSYDLGRDPDGRALAEAVREFLQPTPQDGVDAAIRDEHRRNVLEKAANVAAMRRGGGL